MKRTLCFIALLGMVCYSVGCTPRVRVIANPKPHQKGIRYYRPKPYLLVTSGQAAVISNQSEKTVTTTSIPDKRYVNIQLQYLPDFEEEYALDVRTGFGTADVGIKLEDGWNLTEINQKLDSKTSENIKAVSDLIGSIAQSAAASAPTDKTLRTPPTTSFTIQATNVPLGYYESVIGRDSCGRKRLYGFRYLGFIPYASCPQQMNGCEPANCQTTEMYGLVFEGDAMVFRSLSQLQQLGSNNQFQTTEAAPQATNSNVERTIEFNQAGAVSNAKVIVTDAFKVERKENDEIYVPLPTIKVPVTQ